MNPRRPQTNGVEVTLRKTGTTLAEIAEKVVVELERLEPSGNWTMWFDLSPTAYVYGTEEIPLWEARIRAEWNG